MRAFSVFVFMALSVSVFSENFSNWYFSSHSKAFEVAGKTMSPEGDVIGSFTGSSTGELDSNAGTFTEKFSYTFFPSGKKSDSKIVWSKSKEGVYTGVGSSSTGAKWTLSLTMVSGTVYRIVSVFPDGFTVSTEGQLQKDGSIRTTDKGTSQDGQKAAVMTYVQSRPQE